MIPDDVIFVCGFSGGIDSQAVARWVLHRVPAERVVLLNSTVGGNESPITTDFIERYSREIFPVQMVDPIIGDMWKTPGFAETKGMNSSDPLSFEKMVQIKGRPPSRKAQFCTHKLKIEPMARWLKTNLADRKFIRVTGLRRDESDSRAHTPPSEWDDYLECVAWHPIFDWRKQMCFDYVRSYGEFTNPLYELGFDRVGCSPCINSGRKDIRNWVLRFPERIDRIRAMEKTTGRTFFAPLVPGKHTNNIDEVVEWAMCDRGGKQYSLEVMAPPPVCESSFGLCE